MAKSKSIIKTKSNSKKKAGAHGKFKKWLEPEGLLLLQSWARDGLTDEQIARNIGISRSTLAEWKNKYPDISDTLKKGKEIVDIQVENALLKKAIGFKEKLSKPFKVKRTYYDERGKKFETEDIVYVEEEIYNPPDTTAQIFWLKNRRPDKWRNREEIEVRNDSSTNEILKSIAEQVANKQTQADVKNDVASLDGD